MHISALRITNFRRLKNVLIDLAEGTSILVGSNNSGKTSIAHALQLFISPSGERFSIHDFHSECWAAFNAFGDTGDNALLPSITLDVWLRVGAPDLHRVIDLLPSLTWEGTEVGVRIIFGANDVGAFLDRYRDAKTKAEAHVQPGPTGGTGFQPPPRNMIEYLLEHLDEEFALTYYVLDRAQFDDAYTATGAYVPPELLSETGRSPKDFLKSLLRVDVLSAQRHLSDKAGGRRAEDLSRHLSRFYSRNLEKREQDFDAIRALAESESLLNEHLAQVFQPMLQRLSELGYPGISNPQLLIKSALNPAALMSSNDDATRVYYVLDPDDPNQMTLPDRYNGLGFKNLIYMVVELLDRHAQWLDVEVDRPPLHLVFIEEPEVHLHAQLQQVFIRKVMDILKLEGDDAIFYRTQLVVTTHSPHILYEGGFRPVRYFRRSTNGKHQTTEVLNLSSFYAGTDSDTRDFLERYLKLTHCDLFFSDAAVLVEGNVERLLIPQMIEKVAPGLKTVCVTVLEVGGAFAHRFRTLIEFLGIKTLLITDMDSVATPAITQTVQEPPQDATAQEHAGEAAEEETTARKAVPVNAPNAVTSNQTLIQWLPAMTAIADLLAASPAQKTQSLTSGAHIRVAYETATNVTWRESAEMLAGRTFEEAFALENLIWSQETAQRDLGLRIPRNADLTLPQLATRIYSRVNVGTFKKTDFALALLTKNPERWRVPQYITEGLLWLEEQFQPTAPPTPTVHPGVQEVGA